MAVGPLEGGAGVGRRRRSDVAKRPDLPQGRSSPSWLDAAVRHAVEAGSGGTNAHRFSRSPRRRWTREDQPSADSSARQFAMPAQDWPGCPWRRFTNPARTSLKPISGVPPEQPGAVSGRESLSFPAEMSPANGSSRSSASTMLATGRTGRTGRPRSFGAATSRTGCASSAQPTANAQRRPTSSRTPAISTCAQTTSRPTGNRR